MAAPENPPNHQPQPQPQPQPPAADVVNSETPATDSRDTPKPVAPNPRPPEPSPSSDVGVVHVPSYAAWFSWDDINQCEIRFLPEFFDSRSPSKNPRIYKFYRNSIVKHYRADPARKITFTDVRRTLIGDVCSIRRVFDFLEAWGLINYSPSVKPLKWEDRDSKAGSGSSQAGGAGGASKEENAKKICNHCKSVCSIACFVCDKNDTTLCARCYVRGNYQVGGVSSTDFRRVEICEDSKADWTDKDTLHLLEGLIHYGDDWRKVGRHVGRSEKECVSQFIKLPFGEEFSASIDSGNVDEHKNLIKNGDDESSAPSLSKRMRLTPLADASNPIMAQAAFLSALAGVKVAEAAAQAAVTALSQADYQLFRERFGSHSSTRKLGILSLLWLLTKKLRPHILQSMKTAVRFPLCFPDVLTCDAETDIASNGNTNLDTAEETWVEANSQLGREEHDVERAISGIIEVQMKEIKDKIDRFEAIDLQMEKELRQLEQMKNMLFVDQLTLLFHKNSAQKTGQNIEENVKNG